MRCPKCGAFLEEGKVVCQMCGTNINEYVPNQNFNNFNTNRDANFGSGNDFRNPSVGVNFQKSASNFNDYKKAQLAPLKDEDKDIFDKYAEHKTLIQTCLILLVFAIIAFVGYKYYGSKSKEIAIEPIIGNLYFTIDDSLVMTSQNNNTLTYSKSGGKGNACSITVTSGTGTSGDHVREFFYTRKAALAPELDSSANVVDPLDVYTTSENEFQLKDNTWYFLNIFYKENDNSDPTILRYKYLTSMYGGFYYDIELVNNSNDEQCNASLNNFAKSLEFIEKT